jgi:peptide/nickel transport system substrate-binding protein
MTALRKALTAVSAAAIAALALTGCAGGPGTPSSGSDPLPDSQQKLTFVPNNFPPSLNLPASPADTGSIVIDSQVLQALVKFDGKKATPGLATSWSWTSDTTLQFKLREGVKFSDGAPFTAKDVKETFDAYIGAKSPAFSAQFAPIVSYEATDDHTFTITTSKPVGTLVGFLQFVYIGEAGHVTDPEFWNKPIGTGPFKITEYTPNDHVTMVRNDDYWGPKAKLKSLTFKKITDVSSKITAISNNEAQVVSDVPSDQVDSVKAMDGVKLLTADNLNYFFVWFNNALTPFDDKRVRKAMFEAIDIPTIAKSLYAGQATAMTTFCSPSAFGCVKADLPSYDPKDAKKLLAEAGYPNGFDTEVIFSTAMGAGITDLAPALVSYWKAIGVNVVPRGEDQATWLADFTALTWKVDLQTNQTLTGDADYTLGRLYTCAAKRLGYCNPSLDAVLGKAQQSTDQAERLDLYKQATKILEKDLPFIPMLSLKANAAIRSNVQGLKIPATEFIDFSGVYLN